METILSETESLCPLCLDRIPARRVLREDAVWLDKECPVHGSFATPIWRGEPSFEAWNAAHAGLMPSGPDEAPENCPFTCGLCASHRQQTCCALLEVTERCDLLCPVCFAAAENHKQADPSLPELEKQLQIVAGKDARINIQLSGGEPCLRDDLPEIVALVRSLGFPFVQLNTNGLRIARQPSFLAKLKAAGLDTVFLQFDGTDDAIYRHIRGQALLSEKKQAIDHCREQEVGVVLVPTLIPGINTDNIGNIIDFALSQAPAVRGVHVQPISYFGRYPEPPDNACRVTLPEVISLMEAQTGGMLKKDYFRSPGGPHHLCSFHASFVIMNDGALKPLADNTSSCCGKNDSKNTRDFVARKWTFPVKDVSEPQPGSMSLGGWDDFIERACTHTFCISAMAFQDVWTLDLERLRHCYLHVIGSDGSLVPFCAYNLTAPSGRALYRGKR